MERQRPRYLSLEGLAVDLKLIRSVSLSGLKELRFRSLEPGRVIYWIANLIAWNYETLEHLEIGAENKVAENLRVRRVYNDTDSNCHLTINLRRLLETGLVAAYGPSYPVLPLSSLSLVGLNLLDLEDSRLRTIIDWTKLKALGLKSCSQLFGTLDFLKSAIIKPRGSEEGVNLKSFALRSESVANMNPLVMLLDALSIFLTSFKGLVHLSVLIQDRHMSPQLSVDNEIFQAHGPTLRSLVWDFRLHERTLFNQDVSRALSGNRHLVAIVKWCPLLEELGISLDWSSLMEPRGKRGTLKKVRELLFEHRCCICLVEKVVAYIKSLRHLRTLHIRNLPSLSDQGGKPAWPGISDDELSEGFITKFLRTLIRLRPEEPPNLKIVALGTPRYKYVCDGKASPGGDDGIDEFLKLRVYHVEYRRNFQGDFTPIVTFIAKGTTDAIHDIHHNIDILQADWMA